MTNHETSIANLVQRYAAYVDMGRLELAAELLGRAQIKMRAPASQKLTNSTELLAWWRRVVILYDEGTPRTRHLMTNLDITVDELGDQASCSSYYSVFQEVRTGEMKLILAGRYLDEFAREDDGWYFTLREYCSDFVGDVSAHRRE